MRKAYNGNKASILLMTMAFMVILVVLATVFFTSVVENLRTAGSQNDNAEALYLAEAGINMAIWYLKNTAPDSSTDGSWRTTAYSTSSTGSTYSSCTAGSCNPKTESLNNGTYTMWVETSSNNIKITSKGTFNNLSRTVQVLTTTQPLSGLIAWWKFDTGSGSSATDSSGNSNTGTIVNSPSWVAGQIGSYALNFTAASSQYVRSSSSAAPQSTTVSAWIKPGTAGGVVYSELGQAIVNSGWHDSQIEVETNNIVKTCVWIGSLACVNATSSLTYNQWHHVAFTYDVTTHTLSSYYDGKNGPTSVVTKQYPGTLYFGIGSADSTNAGNGNYFSGTIDDLRVYNRALSASEINQLYEGKQIISIVSTSWKEL